jgi:hypothetical protein
MSSNSINTLNPAILDEVLIINNRRFVFMSGLFDGLYILYDPDRIFSSIFETFTLNDDEAEQYNIFLEEMKLKYEI